ncbi:MAG: hypothetical protein IPM36_05590 [Lewinellaceae bacterium]|nr:hypothetical protein [Lewinellaceae bacterium]
MKNLLVSLLFFMLLQTAHAQDCYAYLRQKGLEAFEKKEFATALQKFEGAQKCPDAPVSNDLNDWLGRTKRRLDPPKPRPVHSTPPLVEKQPNGEIRWTEGFVVAKGQGIINRTKFPVEAQAVLMAQRTAEVVAQANLLAMLKGVFIKRRTTVQDFMAERDDIESLTAGMIRMARFVGEPVILADVVEVTMQAPIQQLGSMLTPVFPAAMSTQDSLEQVVYVAGAMAQPALYPVITDESGAVLYDAEARYRATGRQVFRYGQGAPPVGEMAAVLQALPNPDNSLRISNADWPILQQWVEAAENGLGAAVRLVFP